MKHNEIRRIIDSNLSSLRYTKDQKEQIVQEIIHKAYVKRRMRKRTALTLSVSVLIIILLFMPAVSKSKLKIRSYHWSDSFTLLVDPGQPVTDFATKISISPQVRKCWGDDIADFLLESNAYASLPSWIPPEYTLAHCDLSIDPSGYHDLTALYSNESGKGIGLNISVFPVNTKHTARFTIHSDGEKYETIRYNGIDYYFEENEHNCTVTWNENNCFINILFEDGMDTLCKMVESIGE